MIRPEVVRRRLAKLEEYLAILRSLQRYGLEEFVENPERYGSAERFLQLAIEVTLDLGNHVIAELELVRSTGIAIFRLFLPGLDTSMPNWQRSGSA